MTLDHQAEQAIAASKAEERTSRKVMRRRTARRKRDIDQPITDLSTHPTETVTPAVLAAHQRCDARTIIRMIECQTLVGYKVGREWRVLTASAREMFPLGTERRAS